MNIPEPDDKPYDFQSDMGILNTLDRALDLEYIAPKDEHVVGNTKLTYDALVMLFADVCEIALTVLISGSPLDVTDSLAKNTVHYTIGHTGVTLLWYDSDTSQTRSALVSKLEIESYVGR